MFCFNIIVLLNVLFVTYTFSAVSIYSHDRNDYKFDLFVDSVKPFNFSNNTITETTHNLSFQAKRFAMYSIMLSTQHFIKSGGQKQNLLKRIDEEFDNPFIKQVVQTYFQIETPPPPIKKPQKEKTLSADAKPFIPSNTLQTSISPRSIDPVIIEIHRCESTDIPFPRESTDSLAELTSSHKSFDSTFNLRKTALFLKNFLDYTPSLLTAERTKKTSFKDLSKTTKDVNLTFFKCKQDTPKWIDHYSAREALLYNWRLKIKGLEKHLKYHLSGQDNAIESFVAGIFNHYASLIKQDYVKSMDIMDATHLSDPVRESKHPSSILIVGPSGSGKTEMVKLAAEFLNYPIGRASGANLSPAGYKGDDPKDAVNQLIEHAMKFTTPSKAQKYAEKCGIIFIDEIDKLSARGDSFREASQTALLTFIEGSQQLSIGSDMYYDSSHNLFICSGAFSHLEKTKTLKKIMPGDLISYGLLPELVNRMQQIVQTKPLTKDDFLNILIHPTESPLLRNMREILELKHIKIEFKVDALERFAQEIEKDGIGARNLYGLLQIVISIHQNHLQQMVSSLQSMVDLNANCLKEMDDTVHYNPELLKVLKQNNEAKLKRLESINKVTGIFSNDVVTYFKDFSFEQSIKSILNKISKANDLDKDALFEEIHNLFVEEHLTITEELKKFKIQLKKFVITKETISVFSKLRKDDDEIEKIALRYGIV